MISFRALPEEERPRERMIEHGAKSLSNVELIALLLRTGSAKESVIELAQRVLMELGGMRGLLSLSYHELVRIYGVGPAKAVQVMAGIELGRRIGQLDRKSTKPIQNPQDAVNLMNDELAHLPQEHFVCMFLNTKNRVINKKCIFIGSLNSSVVHPREVFREAVRCSAAGFICIHNHPSGDPTPSPEDLDITFRLVESGRIMGIVCIDHIIIGHNCYYSMKEQGLIEEE